MIQILFRRNIPGFDLANYRQKRAGRPVKNVLFNLIELADNVDGFKNYTQGRWEQAMDIEYVDIVRNSHHTLVNYFSQMTNITT